MKIRGIGIVHSRGYGIESLEHALCGGWIPPTVGDNGLPAYRVAPETLKNKPVLKSIRRADRFSKMAVLAAYNAVCDSGMENETAGKNIGIIVATAFGPHATTFKFLDDIIEYGEKSVSPTTFSHSVHNAAASYISKTLGVNAITSTITQFEDSFYQGLLLAQSWLTENRCKKVLLCAVDECSPAMEYICSRKMNTAADGRIKPFDCNASPEAVIGEGSLAFMLTQTDETDGYGTLCLNDNNDKKDLCLICANGMTGSEESYIALKNDYDMFAAYTPLFGSSMTGNAFDCAVAAYMFKQQTVYASPIVHNPHNFTLCDQTEKRTLNTIDCVSYARDNKKSVLHIQKNKAQEI